jgi:hypothetical protein
LRQKYQLVAKTITDCLASENEIPTLLILAQLKNYQLQLDPLAWQEMLEVNISNNLPPVLEQVLMDLARTKQQLKNLEVSIADNLFLTQNSYVPSAVCRERQLYGVSIWWFWMMIMVFLSCIKKALHFHVKLIFFLGLDFCTNPVKIP